MNNYTSRNFAILVCWPASQVMQIRHNYICKNLHVFCREKCQNIQKKHIRISIGTNFILQYKNIHRYQIRNGKTLESTKHETKSKIKLNFPIEKSRHKKKKKSLLIIPELDNNNNYYNRLTRNKYKYINKYLQEIGRISCS